MKFTIKDFFSICDQIRRKLRIWVQLLKKSSMKNFFFCAVFHAGVFQIFQLSFTQEHLEVVSGNFYGMILQKISSGSMTEGESRLDVLITPWTLYEHRMYQACMHYRVEFLYLELWIYSEKNLSPKMSWFSSRFLFKKRRLFTLSGVLSVTHFSSPS